MLMMMMAMDGSIIENGGEEKAKQILRFRCSCNFIRP